jgi:hypothetical protein
VRLAVATQRPAARRPTNDCWRRVARQARQRVLLRLVLLAVAARHMHVHRQGRQDRL